MDARDRQTAERARSLIERGRLDPSGFRSALVGVAPLERDAWVDRAFALDGLPDDGPDLPRGCVPYLPCPVDALLRMVDQAPVRASDVFVDVGSGAGRAAALVHLLTGASVIGLEIQRDLVLAARDLATRLRAPRIAIVEGDAADLTGRMTTASVFFLYCPFSGERLIRVLADLECIARTRMLRIGCVDLPLPARPWLTLDPQPSGDLAIHRTTFHDDVMHRPAPCHFTTVEGGSRGGTRMPPHMGD